MHPDTITILAIIVPMLAGTLVAGGIETLIARRRSR